MSALVLGTKKSGWNGVVSSLTCLTVFAFIISTSPVLRLSLMKWRQLCSWARVVSIWSLWAASSFKSLECELVSEIAGTRASCSVERRGQSQYEISYQPTIKGRHQLHIKVQGQHIRGSPLSLAAKSPVEKLGDSILTIDEVCGPFGVAVNQRGEVVVVECWGNCISLCLVPVESISDHLAG